jgi:molybdenum ABC transporter molybdate-binding protein
MRNTALLISMLGCALVASPSNPSQQQEPSNPETQLTIAASAELNPAITQLARAFEEKSVEQRSGNRIHIIVVEPPTNLHSSITDRSSADAIFLSDIEDIKRLPASGALLGSSVREIARDQLVICISPLARVEFPPRSPLLGLKEKAVSSIAIPDPRTVYGKAAKQALKSIKVYSPVIAEKLAVGKDLSDVAQLMERGDASAAILPKSALQTYSLRGTRVIPIAQSLYTPIRTGAGVTRRSKHKQEAIQFLRFAVSPDGQAVFSQSGFSESKPPARKR